MIVAKINNGPYGITVFRFFLSRTMRGRANSVPTNDDINITSTALMGNETISPSAIASLTSPPPIHAPSEIWNRTQKRPKIIHTESKTCNKPFQPTIPCMKIIALRTIDREIATPTNLSGSSCHRISYTVNATKTTTIPNHAAKASHHTPFSA